MLDTELRCAEMEWQKQFLDMTLNELVGLISFEDGVAEFNMVAFYNPVTLLSDEMFLAIQVRQKELNDAGYKTFSIENKGWYQLERTWYVWSKEKTLAEKNKKDLAMMALYFGLAFLFLFLIYVLIKIS